MHGGLDLNPDGKIDVPADGIDAFFRDVASDAAGNAYLIGDGKGNFTVQRGATGMPKSYESHRFLASYDPDGVPRWIRPFAAASDWEFSLIEVGPDGDLFVAGSFDKAGVDFDGDGRVELAGRAGSHAFVAQFDSAGTLRDAWPLIALGAGEDQGVYIGAITIAADGDVAVMGALRSPIDFGGDGVADAEPCSGGPSSAFLARCGPQGALRWARSYTIDGAWDVRTDGERFLLAGFYRGERDLNDDGVIDARDGLAATPDQKREWEWVVLVLSEEGRLDHAIPAPGPGNDQARAVGFLPDRRAFYVTGFIQLTADLSGDRTDDEGYVRCDALGDIIIARYGLGKASALGCRLTLAATERREAERWLVDLTWSGANGATVEIHRNGTWLATSRNDGLYTDAIDPPVAGYHVYEIFGTDSRQCSARVEVICHP